MLPMEIPIKRLYRQIHIRPLILMVYTLVSLPLSIRLLLRLNKEHIPESRGVSPLFISVFFIFLFLEVFEFLKWHYNFKSHWILFCFFLLRVMSVGTLVFSNFGELQNIAYIIYFPIICFYLFYAFPPRVSLIFFLTLLGLTLYYDYSFHILLYPTNQLNYVILHKTILGIFFYFLAWFIERDQIQNREKERLVIQLKDYASQVAGSVAMEERTRLARDIHDTLGHSLTAIQIQLSKAEAYMERDLGEATNAVLAAKVTAKDAMFDVRTSLSSLNSPANEIDFTQRTEKLIQGLKGAGISVRVEIEGESKGYNYSVLMALYRFIQEGSTNILKHAGAKEVGLKVTFGKSECQVILEDNGSGFDLSILENESSTDGHYGLSGLRRRLELIRGSITVTSTRGVGTTLRAMLPKDPVHLIGDGETQDD